LLRVFGLADQRERLLDTSDDTWRRIGRIDLIAGTETALQALKDLGVTHVWLTGCLRQAALTGYPALGLPSDDPDVVKGRAGSLYAVRNYFEVCPELTRFLPIGSRREWMSAGAISPTTYRRRSGLF
jgi:hypothetical protein